MTDIMWKPSKEQLQNSQMAEFLRHIQQTEDMAVKDYPALYHWSTKHIERFWPALWRYFQVSGTPGNKVLEHGEDMFSARWFSEAKLNFAQNLLPTTDNTPAIIFRSEHGVRTQLSFKELSTQSAQLAHWLDNLGVGPSDRVAAMMPNLPQTVAAMLATTRIGAIWSSCSPDFGDQGIVDRFGQIEPKVLFTADAYCYKGKTFDCLVRIKNLLQQLPSIKAVVVVPYLNSQPDISALPIATSYHQIIKQNHGEASFEPMPFNHPVYILYSSGTTGKPKCIVHGAGGTLLQHIKELRLHTDLRPGQRLLYFTTCGWMMWNWMVSALAVGCTLVLYEGSPFYPQPDNLLRVVAEEKVNVFGTGAKYLSAIDKAGVSAADLDLSQLRAILSTGSPLLPESFDYIYREIKHDVQLASISGGTDIISCFALGNPLLPVYRGQLQCRGLAMNVQVFSEKGQSVTQQKGELVCTAPFPSMPVGFWNDPQGSRYHAAYFERFKNVWAHGDYAQLTTQGGLIIFGRSDAVLNPGGVRIGTAEIYRQVERLAEVMESLAVGQQWHGDERIVLFVILKAGLVLDETLRQKIRDTIRRNTTARHVPAKIIQIKEIPRTVSGKIVELAVREIIHGREVQNTEALANPQTLDQFKHLPELND